MDCFEGEDNVIRVDHNYNSRVTNHDYIILKSFQNTIVTPRMLRSSPIRRCSIWFSARSKACISLNSVKKFLSRYTPHDLSRIYAICAKYRPNTQ